MLKKIRKIYLLVFISIFGPISVSANSDISLVHAEIKQQVMDFLSEQFNPENSELVEISLNDIDPRKRVSYCDDPLEIEVANRNSFSQRFPIKVMCHTGKPWRVYLNAQINEKVQALVTTQTLAKGTPISADMIELRLVDKHKVKYRSSTDVSAIVGGRAIRNLPANYQIGIQDVCLVCKGDEISIIAQFSNMTIKTSGTALENGFKGETIDVQNNTSNRLVKGIISEAREVSVAM